jgi:FkbM family methyltransferase
MLTEQEASYLFDLQDANNIFEKLIEACYSQILKPGDSAVDGGAHIGMHTIPMANIVGEFGEVYAFEPIHSLADCISSAARKMPQIKVFECALSHLDGDTIFHVMSKEPWLSGIARRFITTEKPVEVIIVRRFRLDTLADKPIRFIKLDLESGEYHALLGAKELIFRQQPVIAFECGRNESAIVAGYSENEYFNLFEELGYKLYDIFGRPFTRSDFKRPYTDRFVPHYLVAAKKNADEIVYRLHSNAKAALYDTL